MDKKIRFYKTKEIFYNKGLNLRDEKNLVYLVKCPAGKMYVGQTIQRFIERIKEHIRHDRTLIEKEIKKKGEDDFEWAILKNNIKGTKELNRYEKIYISQFNTMIPNGYNQTSGGKGTTDYIHSNESREKNSIRTKERMANKKNREKVKKGVLIRHAINPDQGKNHSKLMKNKFDSNTEEGQKNRKNASLKQKQYISKKNNREKHALSHGAKPFLVIKNDHPIGAYLNQSECARKLGLQVGHINSVLKGKRKQTGGYKFKLIGNGILFDEL